MTITKSFFALLFAAFSASASVAQIQGWYQQNSSTTENLVSVSFVDGETGWAGIINTNDGGQNWSSYKVEVNVIRFLDKNFGYGYSEKGPGWVAITTNGGTTWNHDSTGFRAAGQFYFATHDRGFCYVAGYIGRTIDGGKTWSLDTTFVGSPIEAICSYDSLHIVIVGSRYTQQTPSPPHDVAALFVSSDGGNTWRYPSKQYFPNTGFHGITFLDSLSFVIIWSSGGKENTVLKSTNLGYSLTSSSIGDSDQTPMTAICSPSNNNIVVVGLTGKIFRSTNAGTTWTRQNSGTINDLYGVTFTDSLTGWVVGDGGMILHTSNAGNSWVKPQAQNSIEILAIPRTLHY